jgi:hypothetical protein
MSEPRTIRVTPAQADFLWVEIVGRYAGDDGDEAQVAEQVAESLRASKGRAIRVTDTPTLSRAIIDIINDFDDEIERAKKGNMRALDRIGGVETIADARALWRAGNALWRKTL